ncbi:hypothetical protein AZF04_06800 [Alkalihalobacillus trypoxylicola]|uniref:Uncharacterized protein n=1 Tax=Alkalihalobacillus trypoxylicola TaxID=519424 RepID=A0A162DD01_9BACI|nr:hypothetical protein AZF04_06800 [Alkalihalobacillus trypoxylicola]
MTFIMIQRPFPSNRKLLFAPLFHLALYKELGVYSLNGMIISISYKKSFPKNHFHDLLGELFIF